MSISSLPSRYGIGVFGEQCIEFARTIKQMGFSLWQVLPFTPVDYANSPYGSDSAFAGNELYIDPATLASDGYITADEARENEYAGTPYTADYGFARKARNALLRKAFSRLSGTEKEGLMRFMGERGLVNHCLYRALKAENGGKPFWQWRRGSRYSEAIPLMTELRGEMLFHGFVQYIFESQWNSVKRRINDIGVEIIGDIPIYVSLDSADVWANPKLFELDEDTCLPSKVAGVPPDYFSEDGQLWGNPVYNWAYHAETGYKWWTERIKHSLCLYDILRIDHFRAFASYWTVPADAATAREGKWEDGPGKALFAAAEKSLGRRLPIIAEDLGVYGEDVVKLLDDTGFPGMRIIQFGFDPQADSTHLPHNYPKNCVAYIGTHDNNTLLGWLWEATPEERGFALEYCSFAGSEWGRGGYNAPACRSIIETVWRSSAETAVIPFQDMCGFGSDARMNTPGDDSGKWLFRTTRETIDNIDKDYFSAINRIFRRG